MKVTVPEEVGVPESVMVPVPFPEMVSPVVFVTPDTARVTGAAPPVEVIDLLKAIPTSPPGSVDGLRTTDGLTVNE